MWPHASYAIQNNVEWWADDALVEPPMSLPKESEWKLRITKQDPHYAFARVAGQLGMTLKFAFKWLPDSLKDLLESPYHPVSRASATPP